jgi:peptide/nickel transport system ATP-binding protein
LTTAYQISRDIVVLYRGAVAEAGDVGLVVGDPKHPYTQLLVGSIPLPDPERTWEGEKPPSGISLSGDAGCRFAARCPDAMPMCVAAEPPLFQIDEQRVAACYLHRAAPALERPALADLLLHRAPQAGVGDLVQPN